MAVARAFGDSRYKQPKTSQNFVSVDPWLKTVVLNTTHKYLILACDGLWDVCSHEQAAQFAHTAFQSGKTSEQVAKDLVKYALDNKTDDNVTVVIVKIDWESGASSPPQVSKMDVAEASNEDMEVTNVVVVESEIPPHVEQPHNTSEQTQTSEHTSEKTQNPVEQPEKASEQPQNVIERPQNAGEQPQNASESSENMVEQPQNTSEQPQQNIDSQTTPEEKL